MHAAPPSPRPIRRLCVQWPRFGPYHLARLAAAHRHLYERGVALTGLETAGRDATYAWRSEQAPAPFHRVQVFPDRTFEALRPAEVHAGVTAALDRLRPDAVAVNSYSFPDARACLAWCRRHRRVAILMSDSKQDDAPRTAWRERIKALLVGQFDAALLAGTPQRAYLLHLGFPEHCVFLGYDVVDNDFFARGAAEARRRPAAWQDDLGVPAGRPYFLAVSRFLAVKNLDGLLRAYRQYRRHDAAPWPLVLVGDGPERPRLEQAARDLDGVVFAGFRQIDALPGFYGHAGAFVHPALKDTWGLVVNEAMAAGLPVLVSERAGCAQDLVLEGENGFLFDPDDTAHLARLMQRMTAQETDRAAMGRRSQAVIAAWPLERFAEGLWQAAQAGRARADRRFHPAARALLALLRTAARRTHSFHSVKD